MMNKFTSGFLDVDSSLKGYLPEQTILQVCRANGCNSFSSIQFNTLFSALDKNSQGEYTYKQLFELLFGAEQA
jgi:Ca2+-binding EF-hand superfamily protein